MKGNCQNFQENYIVNEGLQYDGNEKSIAFMLTIQIFGDVTISNELKHTRLRNFENIRDIKEFTISIVAAKALKFFEAHFYHK